MSSAEQQQQQEELRMQILQQQQRRQLQQLQQRQYRELLHQQQQHHQQTQTQQQQVVHHQTQLQPYTSSSSDARPLRSQSRARPVSTTIATLKDALAYPEQPPQLVSLQKPPVGRTTPGSHSSNSNSHKSAKAVKRKKFPPGLARFRDRLQHLEERLRLDVNALKQEICDLQLRRGIMETRVLTTRFCATGSAAKLVREYFAMFPNGIQSLPDGAELLLAKNIGINNIDVTLAGFHGSSSPQSQQPSLLLLQQQIEAANRQNAFIEGLLDTRMEFHKYVGRDVLREQWLRYSQCYADLRMQLFSVMTASTAEQDEFRVEDMDSSNNHSSSFGEMDDCVASTIVHTRGELTAYITQQTLEQIFPNVLRNPGLTQRLLGAYIEYPFCIEFHVSAGGKITKYDPEIDFVSALSKVLGNFDDVTLLMRDALISDYCMIGALDMYPVTSDDYHFDYDAPASLLLRGHDV